ncbi:MAG: DnaJ domain-containing protein, partial [Planctomycetes bacterium]|nr:DnaJ domain-containing protein [Planctomycetota bacterium]
MAAPRITESAYDGYDRIVTFVDPMGNVTEYHYDPNSNVGGFQDPAEIIPNPFGSRVFGDVVDISTTGMRIRCERKPPIKVGQYIEAKLESNSHRLPVSGLVIWVRRKGFKGYEVGIKFVNIKRSLQAAIESLGMFGFIDLEAAAAAKEKKYGPTKTKKRIRASINLPDYYSIRGLDSDATGGEIKNAFRMLARRYHPDVAKRQDDAQKFLEISQAYDVLRDSESRKSYDMRRAG